MVMVVPAVGKPACPGCNIKSFTGATFVTGWASDITAISFSRESLFPPAAGTKPGLRTKLVIPMPGPEMGLNDMDGGYSQRSNVLPSGWCVNRSASRCTPTQIRRIDSRLGGTDCSGRSSCQMPPAAAAVWSLMTIASAGWAIESATAAVPPSRIAARRAMALRCLPDEVGDSQPPALPSRSGLTHISHPPPSCLPPSWGHLTTTVTAYAGGGVVKDYEIRDLSRLWRGGHNPVATRAHLAVATPKATVSRRDRARIDQPALRCGTRSPSSVRTGRYWRCRGRIRQVPCRSLSDRASAARHPRP